ncbi:nociceptin receptor [Gouania willdenowi]|uniref:nociceptin receptor n=1 Tax=Gouania willdenowi TaxID=441366 RepID=UPI001054C517|nr:nociceptin receptor-like [Gouania willdenowi]
MAVLNPYVLVFASCLALILVMGLSANLLVISLFSKRKSRRNHLDVLLLSMTLADLLTLLLVPLTLHSAVSYSWPLGDTSCKVYQFLLAFGLSASTYSLCAVSVTRAVIITNPYRPPAADLLLLLLVLVWALSFFISLPLRMFATKESVESSSFCLPTVQEHHYQVVLGQFLLFYLLPMAVIAISSAWLSLYLHRCPVMSTSSTRNTRRALLMVFMAAASFSSCWLPGYVLELCVFLGLYRHGAAWDGFYFLCTVLQYVHPCINPVIYVLLSKRYESLWRNRVQPQVISATMDSLSAKHSLGTTA